MNGLIMTASANTAVVSAFSGIADEMTATLSAIAPIAVPILGVFLVWGVAKKFFKKASN